MTYRYHSGDVKLEDLGASDVFVFGSNILGHHGSGSARYAYDNGIAEYGVGQGFGYAQSESPMVCLSYALPTLSAPGQVLSLHQIRAAFEMFIVTAVAFPEWTFYLTAVGTGVAGFSHEQIARTFVLACSRQEFFIPTNIIFPPEWSTWIEDIPHAA